MIAALVVSWISHPTALFDHFVFSLIELQIISALSSTLAVSVAIKVLTLNGPVQDGSLLAALFHFVPSLFAISIMLATYVRIATTNRASAVNWHVVLIILLSIVPGLLSASKEWILTPFVLVCGRGSFTASLHAVGNSGSGIGYFSSMVFVYPFSQNARFVIRYSKSISDKASLVIQFSAIVRSSLMPSRTLPNPRSLALVPRKLTL